MMTGAWLTAWSRGRRVQPTYLMVQGGCVDCGHLQRVHERGKDTPIPCTSLGCACPGFRTRRLVLGRWRRG